MTHSTPNNFWTDLVQQPASLDDRLDMIEQMEMEIEIETRQYDWDYDNGLIGHKILLTQAQIDRFLGEFAPTPFHTVQDTIVLLANRV